jgi:hypothetical protein
MQEPTLTRKHSLSQIKQFQFIAHEGGKTDGNVWK